MIFKKAPKLATPLPNTYWVIPGRLLAGEHPSGNDTADSRKRLELLRAAGIDYFMDLTESGERPSYQPWLPPGTDYVRNAIPDMLVPERPQQMQAILSTLLDALTLGRRVYVHCRAGIGRTGTVIGCFLVEEGRDGKDALKHLNRLWQQSERAKTWPSVPQTPGQTEYVKRWRVHRKIALSQRIDS